MIDSELFPKIFIRNVDLDCVGFDISRRDNPHVNDTKIVLRIPGRNGSPQPRQARPRRISDQEDLLSIDVELSFQSNNSSSPFDDFIDKDFVNRYMRVVTVLIDDVKLMTKVLDNFGDLPTSALQGLNEQGVINMSNSPIYGVDFEADVNERIKDNIIRINFKHSDIEPEYLAVAAYSFFDIQAMEEDLDLDLTSNKELIAASSTISVENIIINGRVVSDSFIFLDVAGNIYNGPVEVKKEKYYKYGTTELLREQRIPNSVVSDFRPIKDFKEKNIEFSSLNRTLADKFDTTTIQNRTRAFKPQMFSDLFLTQDENASSRFGFAIDFKEILTERGRYGFLFTTDDKFRQKRINQLSRISDISVYRQRVKKVKRTNSLGTMSEDIDYFNDSRERKLIANNSERSYKTLNKKEFFTINGQEQELVGIIREVDADFNNMRMFSVSDEELKDITDGLYAYHVDVEIEDGTVFFVENLYKETLMIRDFLENYLNRSELPDNFEMSGKLAPTYIETLIDEELPWSEMAVKFITNLIFIFDDIDPALFSTLKMMFNPQTTTLQGLRYALDTVTDFVQYLERELINNSYIRNFSTSRKSIHPLRRNLSDYTTIKISKQFEVPIADSNIVKNKGMEFLEFEDENGIVTYDDFDGLAAIHISKFNRRADNETEKYFNGANTPIDLRTEGKKYLTNDNTENNKFGFFSVSKLKIDKNSVNYIGNKSSFDHIQTSLWELSSFVDEKIKAKNNLETRDYFNKSERAYKGKALTFMNNVGVTVSREDEELDKTVDWKDKFGSEEFVGRDTTESTRDKPIQQIGFSGFKNIFNNLKQQETLSFKRDDRNLFGRKEEKTSAHYDMKSPLNVLDKLDLDTSKIQALPNQHKSILMGSLGNNAVNSNIFVDTRNAEVRPVDEDTESSFIISYENLVKIEGLTGFKFIGGNYSVKSPRWEMLTKDVLDHYPFKELLCRATRYDSQFFSRRSKNVFNKMPIYNEYFIIRFDTGTKQDTLEEIQQQVSTTDQDTVYLQGRSNSGVFEKSE